MKRVVLGVRAMRTGRSQATGKLTELMRFHCGEDLGRAISYAAIESRKSVSESLRIAVETTYFGHLHQLRLAVSARDIGPNGRPARRCVRRHQRACLCSRYVSAGIPAPGAD